MNHFDNELEIRQILLRESLEIRKTKTSPKNPKANGQIEHFNRTLLAMIKSYLRGEQKNGMYIYNIYLVVIEQPEMSQQDLPEISFFLVEK
jgi:hypothetical protein